MSHKYKYPEVLKNFLEEFFDFEELCKVGLLKKEWKNDHQKQADRICEYFGLDNIFEYGAFESERPAMVSNADGTAEFISFKNIYKQ